ncbi:MAG: 3-keto-5-aminohexanoate cleavage protein [Gammaproteobacteria bacterium]
MNNKGIMIMAAVNGARLTKQQCPAVPITIGETACAAKECYDAGAKAVHAHIRDKNGGHLLDAGAYHELIDEIKTRAPKLMVQITTESGGKYTPHQQREIARQTGHNEISAALREITADNDKKAAADFYHLAGVRIQHILYSPAEVHQLAVLIKGGIIPAENVFVLFVLGDYQTRAAMPADLLPFLAAMKKATLKAQTMACAFGRRESDCLLAAAKAGMHCRVGLENNHYNENGNPAKNNAERVAEIRKKLKKAAIPLSPPFA